MIIEQFAVVKKYFLLINVIVGFACTSTVDDFELIDSQEMSALLIDIHIMEARIDRLKIKGDSVNRVFNSMERQIFEEHEVSKVQYEKSYAHYLSNPRELDMIYSIVVDSLNLYQKRGYQEDQKKLDFSKASPISRDSSLYRLNKERISPIDN